MIETRIKISSVVQNQVPEFVREEFPLVSEFLNQYYSSLESQGSSYDILSNLDQYVKVDTLFNIIDSTTLTSNISIVDTVINVESTAGFPDSYGLILIDSEIITYKRKTDTSFIDCVRGFSGIKSLDNSPNNDELIFSDSSVEKHEIDSEVKNLSVLFLQKFFLKLKKQITPGFEDRTIFDEVDKRIFIKQSVDFYSSKGTDRSFEILFRALYGKDVAVIKPRDYLIQPSDAEYKVTKDLVVEKIDGDINQLLNKTIYQDQNSFISKARGTVTQVEKIQRSDKEYYVLSLDIGYQRDIDVDGTIFGNFTIHPKTLLVSDIKDIDNSVGVFSPNSNALDVDSTVGFPQSGNLVIDLENGSQLLVSYTDKSLNQFFNCTGITQEIPSGTAIKSDVYSYGYDDLQRIIKFRVTGVLSNLNLKDSNSLFLNGDLIKIKTLGNNIKDQKFNNWFFNIETYYITKSIRSVDLSNNSYSIDFYNNHSFVVGDKVSILPSYGRPGNKIDGTVVSFNDEKSIVLYTEKKLKTNEIYDVRKILSKFNSDRYPSLKYNTTNVQNIYIDDEKSLYVASPSLPSYLNQKIDANDYSITFSGSFNGEILNIENHPFYTGDSVYYRSGDAENNLGISDGYYFVKRIDGNNIQIARSREDLFNSKYISLLGEVVNNKLEFSSFVSENTGETKQLESQKLFRKISDPVNDGNSYETLSGSTGILINGVEILNYKSKDRIFYGPLENIYVSSSGSGYDVINPPILQIADLIGSGATAYCSVKGNLERIDIIDGGFDYLEEPKIIVSGGNGFGANARAKLISFDHFANLNANPSSNNINESSNQITFIDDHKFRDHEQVIYLPQDETVVGGLSTNSSYFVSVIDSKMVKLHNNYADSVSGINTISITNNGSGIHRFKSFDKKRKIGSIDVVNSGNNYENKKRTCTSTGINTALNTIYIQDHGYNSGEILTYEFTNNSIVGLSSTSKYYVTKIDNNNFKLSLVGTSTTQPQNINYSIGEYINFKSSGEGVHIFNYEPITVTVSGRIGVSTLTGQNFNAILQPIFRGSIESVHIQDGGNSFGSEEILNYNRQPQFILLNGSGAKLTPVINNGSIVDVIINDPGSNYNSPPNIIVIGSGFGAVLTPIISNGSIVSVNIIFGGIGYLSSDTSIQVISAGSSAKFESLIKSWNINLFERFINSNIITDDDGILEDSFSGFGLEYFHLYSPRKLRSSVFGKKYRNGRFFYEPDLKIVNGNEVKSEAHSPIIGWSYDGNPIYGPYGYSSITGGSIKSMVSGYQLKSNSNRPNKNLYSIGFFVEDYEFVGNGDLDEHNGRFCVTPEYPNGVYAYFTTIGNQVESNGSFKNYRLPVFPYIIGNSYKSKPEEFNFKKSSNQSDININNTNWIRNTTPYNILNSNSGYDFLYNPNNIKEQNSTVNFVTKGTISSIGIIAGGNNYQVNDSIIFEDNDLSSIKPKASVSTVKGKLINSISTKTSELENLEFHKYLNGYVAFSSVPHNFNDLDIITFSSDFETLQNSIISFNNNTLYTSTGIGSTQYTGIITYFNVSGNLTNSSIRENDVYQILNEKIKVIDIDYDSSRIKVIRNIEGISGIQTYSSGIAITEVSRKFYLSLDIKNTYNPKVNRQIYFNPAESLGIGTTSGVGINTTLTFSNPGVGQTQITIPTRSIYLPNHQLETGDELIYSSNGGNPISISTDGVSSYQLSENSIVYATKRNLNEIGISSNRVGISTVENILYLVNIGSGENHSFSTNYKNILTGNISKNEVTVSTASSHGLRIGDSVVMNIISGISTQISLEYNDYNRRTIINKLNFLSSNIDTAKNTITIPNHGLYTSQKVIYTSSSPSVGLSNEGIYYVIVVDKNNIKLSDSYYYSSRRERSERSEININSASPGSISPINPRLTITNKNRLVFDLSSPTLSFTNNGIKYSAFSLDFYTDSNFKNIFNFTNANNVEILRSGRVGIDTDAKVVLEVNDSTPRKLYYKLNPINLNIVPLTKKEIVIDNEINSNNEIDIVSSSYNGLHSIVGVTSNTFNYLLRETPEKLNYDVPNSDLEYVTNSKSVYGEINSVSIDYEGKNLSSIPKIENISSNFGSGAILETFSDNIGKILKTSIDDIGFGYSNDYSIRPTAKLPDQININPQSSFKFIGISSVGKNYYIAPDLVVLDGLTKEIISDVDLRYELSSRKVNILKNTKAINNITPIIIPINNTNGVPIDSITYNDLSGDVVVTLGSSFSDAEDFPFKIGDKVLIENTSVGVGTTLKGYNSSNYNYTLFTIKNTDPNIGGIGATVSYNISQYLLDGEFPGTFDSENSLGRIIPQKYFPIFDIELEKNTFNKGEIVFSGESYGTVIDWDKNTEILKVSTNDIFSSGNIITSKTSNSKGIIKNVTTSEVVYDIDATSDVVKGWQRETGFLNNNFQRVHDNDYYQYFSYSIKSQVPLDTWDNAVGNLNHTAGFKRFSDLVIESSPTNSGIKTDQHFGDFSGIADLSRTINLNCVHDFDLVTENNIIIDNSVKSSEIIFESRVIQDYIESLGNRVLLIDDISPRFSSNPRPTKFSIVDTFELSEFRSNKFLILVEDKIFKSEKQLSIVTILNDGSNGYINQYGAIDTYGNLGYFDFGVSGSEANLIFYPKKFLVNDYDISSISFNISDSNISTGSTNIGDIISLESSKEIISSGTSSPTTIVGIGSTYRSSKILLQISSSDRSYFEFNEITILHDGNKVIMQEYGQLNTSTVDSYLSNGIGTYHAYYSGSDINIDLIPKVETSLDYNIDCIKISIASTLSIGTDSKIFDNSRIESDYISISSSSTPGISTISSCDSFYDGSYFIVCVEDVTNNQYQVSEILTLKGENDEVYFTEFGVLQSNSSIGLIGSTISNNNIDLTFIPNPDIDVEVRVYKNTIGTIDSKIKNEVINLGNSFIRNAYGFYTGTETDIRREFSLNHKGNNIFERYFDGSDSNIVNIEDNTIEIPENFFVTGENVTYSIGGGDISLPIGIATTTIPGIGSTDKLPTSLYIVKENELKVKVAISASDALKTPPNVLDITSVGIGTSHRFISKNQNSKVLIAIDNLIQSPIVATSVTATTTEFTDIDDVLLTFSGITSFFGGDLIKIDDEIMRINSVGLGSTNVVLVQRPWMGTGITTHQSNSIITKVKGDFNIVDNKINFVTAPYGLVPIGSITNPPDSRDFVGIETRSTFSGRTFIRSGFSNSDIEPYSNNYVFDDISSNFDGKNKKFTLKSNGEDIVGFSTSNSIILINDILQGPARFGAIEIDGNYSLSESSGITSITFTGTASSSLYDINAASIPRGGILVSVGSTAGFGYQPLVSAGGTAIVSIAGTIESISIGNSGSGYRSGIQTVNVGVSTSSLDIPNITYIGTATVVDGHITGVAITNPGIGFTSTNPPIVVFDSPLSYSNIPLIYSSSSVSGIGTFGIVDIVVGQGSSVISFEITNTGYGYGQGEILTISIGGTVGIPTNKTLPFEEFRITVDRTFSDEFSGWSIGDLQVIDPIDSLFDGKRKIFPIKINGEQTTIRSRKGSNIEVKANLLIFINNILQVPDISYTFNGGSVIRFKEAPKEGDTSKILFYRGTGEVDTINIDVLETVKEGDTLKINSDIERFKENDRLVTEIISTDIIETNLYPGPGISQEEQLRPVIWCRQTEDKIINGVQVPKDRILYEPLINPTSNLIQSISIGSTQIFVESVKTFFDSADEYLQDGIKEKPQRKIIITSQDSLIAAAATAIVSIAGTIESIIISDGGVGYSTDPIITVENPIGVGTTQRATATSTISVGGTVSSITISNPGIGYDSLNPPVVLISPPKVKREVIDDVRYEGDFGIITGINTTSVGVASTGIVFDFFIPEDSVLRDTTINSVGIATTGISGIQTGYYFIVYNSNIGNGLTSIYQNGSIIGIGTTFIDNIYEVASVSIGQTDVIGVGLTYVAKVTVSVSDYNGLSGLGYSSFFGEYSWGRIYNLNRTNPSEFIVNNNGLIGILTSPIVQRYNPLKYRNYVS